MVMYSTWLKDPRNWEFRLGRQRPVKEDSARSRFILICRLLFDVLYYYSIV